MYDLLVTLLALDPVQIRIWTVHSIECTCIYLTLSDHVIDLINIQIGDAKHVLTFCIWFQTNTRATT